MKRTKVQVLRMRNVKSIQQWQEDKECLRDKGGEKLHFPLTAKDQERIKIKKGGRLKGREAKKQVAVGPYMKEVLKYYKEGASNFRGQV